MLVFLHQTDECEVFFNDIPCYIDGMIGTKNDEYVIRSVVEDQREKSGRWFVDFLKVLVVKGIDTCPYRYEDIYPEVSQ